MLVGVARRGRFDSDRIRKNVLFHLGEAAGPDLEEVS